MKVGGPRWSDSLTPGGHLGTQVPPILSLCHLYLLFSLIWSNIAHQEAGWKMLEKCRVRVPSRDSSHHFCHLLFIRSGPHDHTGCNGGWEVEFLFWVARCLNKNQSIINIKQWFSKILTITHNKKGFYMTTQYRAPYTQRN